jgi:hypothetical protein
MLTGGLPATREARWALLEAVLERWFPGATPSGVASSDLDLAERRLALRLPVALREWYELHGARADVWSLQDRLFMPDQLRLEDGVLTFAIESQGVVRWGIRLDDLDVDDPPVVVSDPDRRGYWSEESDATSSFAIQYALLNAKWSDAVTHHANGQATDEALDAIARCHPRLPFPDMHWPGWPTRFYGGDDVLVETVADTWIWISARTEQALEAIDAQMRDAGVVWEHISRPSRSLRE